MDVRMPNMNGIEATRLLKAQAPEIRVVMLTVSDDERDLFDAVRAGAQGYLLKDLEGDSFIDALEAIERGESVVPTQMSRNLFDEFRAQSRRLDYGNSNGQQLSAREHEVVTHVSEGITNRAVGVRMEISENTVKFHMKNILAKLRLQNRAQLVAWAAARGMVKEPEPSR
jgi:DNA-binding NarL/FixJ family response regulator